MFTLIAQCLHWFRSSAAPVDSDYVQSLMEGAGARVGLDPAQAHELRRAASAYLSVVR